MFLLSHKNKKKFNANWQIIAEQTHYTSPYQVVSSCCVVANKTADTFWDAAIIVSDEMILSFLHVQAICNSSERGTFIICQIKFMILEIIFCKTFRQLWSRLQMLKHTHYLQVAAQDANKKANMYRLWQWEQWAFHQRLARICCQRCTHRSKPVV